MSRLGAKRRGRPPATERSAALGQAPRRGGAERPRWRGPRAEEVSAARPLPFCAAETRAAPRGPDTRVVRPGPPHGAEAVGPPPRGGRAGREGRGGEAGAEWPLRCRAHRTWLLPPFLPFV